MRQRPLLADALLAALFVATVVSIGIVATPEASDRGWTGSVGSC